MPDVQGEPPKDPQPRSPEIGKGQISHDCVLFCCHAVLFFSHGVLLFCHLIVFFVHRHTLGSLVWRVLMISLKSVVVVFVVGVVVVGVVYGVEVVRQKIDRKTFQRPVEVVRQKIDRKTFQRPVEAVCQKIDRKTFQRPVPRVRRSRCPARSRRR